MNLAVAALKDPPVGPGVAEVAMPLDEGAVGLDHLEDVSAAACEGHGCRLLVRGLGFLRGAVWGVRCKNLEVQIQIDWEMRSR